MLNILKKNFTLLIIVFFIFLPILSFAQGIITDPEPSESVTIVNPLPGITSVNGLLQTILEGAIKIGIPVIVLAIIYSGFLFVSAQGNTEKLGTAKKSLIYTLIGAAILLGSWAIAQLITNTVIAL